MPQLHGAPIYDPRPARMVRDYAIVRGHVGLAVAQQWFVPTPADPYTFIILRAENCWIAPWDNRKKLSTRCANGVSQSGTGLAC
ncbi:hypothetical protein MESS2_1650030 [Mesorhizobium metallidurans STM 2683]|uniref:Uncharacterized protein n=1 Tax=Mesorhizobium metallidurans STM 2683 TaxID=1297569 RepID=M5EN37_9HYPH|nr:hypothetical protein MESS2_1650030 [Mesorhizobium metallidurans STM 2683]